MEMTLLLNSTYEPLRVLHWQKAITLLWQGKVEVPKSTTVKSTASRSRSNSPRSCGS